MNKKIKILLCILVVICGIVLIIYYFNSSSSNNNTNIEQTTTNELDDGTLSPVIDEELTIDSEDDEIESQAYNVEDFKKEETQESNE